MGIVWGRGPMSLRVPENSTDYFPLDPACLLGILPI